MLSRFFKRNSIIVIYVMLCIVVASLVMVELDKQYYQAAKNQFLLDNWDWYLEDKLAPNTIKKDLLELAHLSRLNPQPAIQNQLYKVIDEILKSDSFVYGVMIEEIKKPAQQTQRPTLEAEKIISIGGRIDNDKFRRLNNFSNSLFLRNFSHSQLKPLAGSASLTVYYTSPLNDPAIEELTTLYRWRAFFILIILAALAAWLARRVLLPLNRVTNALESSSPEQTVFLDSTRSRLERLYNGMALDAVSARLQGQLRGEIARHPQMTGWEAVSFVCKTFGEQVGAPMVACLEMVAEGPGRIRATGLKAIAGRADLQERAAELAEMLDAAMPRDGRSQAPFTLNQVNPPLQGVVELMTDPERTGIRYLFALGLEDSTGEGASASMQRMLTRLIDLVEAGLQTISLRNQLLVQERGRANISLSRNLGHDLTNIIATSKLELMALDRLLGKGELPADPRKRAILTESLHGLLRSIRFMQETVNLYRAYAYLQHPVLETHEGNRLVVDTIDLFEMSISAKIQLIRELAEDAPRAVVDPRLFKLALFNLFSNALEALRKKDPEYTAQGWIKVVTRRSREGGLCVAIEDSGTGILNSAGRRAQAHEIEKIFELGYTSYRLGGSQGEGLGLNWVRTIIQDLHNGVIFAENVEDAGARFVLIFPPLENAPIKESTETAAREYLKKTQVLMGDLH